LPHPIRTPPTLKASAQETCSGDMVTIGGAFVQLYTFDIRVAHAGAMLETCHTVAQVIGSSWHILHPGHESKANR
jgi:hypothetical protein